MLYLSKTAVILSISIPFEAQISPIYLISFLKSKPWGFNALKMSDAISANDVYLIKCFNAKV